MAAPCMKRLARERERLPKDNSEFFINFKDENLRSFEAYIIGPEDSLYKHKFIKLKFDIPSNYPLAPPKVTFIQHTGDRIHPNLYTEGKVCLSILGTWSGEKWAYSMTIESVLITIRSLLDNKPYMHEPHQSDNPNFNAYVRFNTWKWLLLDYLDRERDPDAKAFLQEYIQKHGAEMIGELERQMSADGYFRELVSPYKRGTRQIADYRPLLADLRRVVFLNSSPLIEPSAPAQGIPNGLQKREGFGSTQNDEQPKKKQKSEPCVIDLTGSP